MPRLTLALHRLSRVMCLPPQEAYHALLLLAEHAYDLRTTRPSTATTAGTYTCPRRAANRAISAARNQA